MSAPACLAGGARARRALEVADLLRDHLDAVLRESLGSERHAAVRALLRCCTAQLGGHLDTCAVCGFARPSYDSCRDRHCPKCQGLAQARWVRARMQRVLRTHHRAHPPIGTERRHDSNRSAGRQPHKPNGPGQVSRLPAQSEAKASRFSMSPPITPDSRLTGDTDLTYSCSRVDGADVSMPCSFVGRSEPCS
jgi:hypothetical protein